ncbi:MAG: transcription elongation factor GreA [Peptococcaceae bacterium]|nr:transcription elongation factor GreA [Peptococcaceae bacterium]MBQ2014490.1 transcription elongation factor GreA [Peptococcaceae bacterium]MBQ2014941.1 transcription elongation factor GreA [Peptococcaceae bacterium]MBQ2035488.1 transcription elongation factor GreA [Peptococcaceae bacterium]MBQ2119532.1 transcription elongation factor GreA [Peptococcaceae bacterium]
MSEQDVILTREGLEQLEQELENLRTVKRTEVKERLKEAIALGDLSENSEYDDAKNEQAFMEGRILELEKMIRNAKIIEDGEQQNDTITVGSLVTVKDIEFDEITEYRLVGTVEADPMNNRISNESPVGRALLGHKAGEIIDVEVPAGVIQLEIVSISK